MDNVLELKLTPNKRIESAEGPEGKFLETLLQFINREYEINIQLEGNWTKLIGRLGMKEADLSVNDISVTKTRFEVVDFSPVYAIDPVTFVSRAAGLKNKRFVYVYPFEPMVWISLLITLVIGTFILCKMLLVMQGTKGSHMKLGPIQVFFCLYGLLVKQGFRMNLKNTNTSFRMFVGAFLLLSITLTFSYAGVLLSLILTPIKEDIPETISDLIDAIHEGRYDVGVKGGTFTESVFKGYSNGCIGEIGKRINKKENLWPYDMSMILNFVRNHDYAFINSKDKLKIYVKCTADPDSYFISDDYFFIGYNGVAMRKGLPEKGIIERIIHRLNEGGFYNKWSSDALFKIQMKSLRRLEDNKERKLTLEDQKGAFLLLACGYFLATIVLLIEILIHKYGITENLLFSSC